MRFGVIWIISWAGEDDLKLSIQQKGDGEALPKGFSTAKEKDMLFAGDLIARGFIYNKRLFFWTGNKKLHLLVLPLLILFDDSKENDLY